VGIFAAAAAVALIAVGGFALINSDHAPQVPFEAPTSEAPEVAGLSQLAGIFAANSYDEVLSTLTARFDNAGFDGGGYMVEEYADITPADGGGTDSGAPIPDAGSSTSQTSARESDASYSETNVQVAGVDEADSVKTDGTYIYALFGNDVIIFEAKGRETEEISRIHVSVGLAYDLYVSNDRLVVLFMGGLAYNSYFDSIAFAAVYDVKDPKKPEFINALGQDGSLNNSRLIGNMLYVITDYRIAKKYIDPDNPHSFVPNHYEGDLDAVEELFDSAHAFAEGAILMIPDYSSTQYTVITAIDINRVTRTSELAFLGNTSTVYMSHNNLFLSGQIDADRYSGYDTLGRSLPASMYGMEETRISRVSLEGGGLSLAASTSVVGVLLNQFSLDEYNGFLRAAFTETKAVTAESGTNSSSSEAEEFVTANKLLVFDSDLRIIGSIENMAPDEIVYSARFAGDVGYLVTFRLIDPLFSLDLSDPQNPRVMDALKIPGFSSYLHPYAEGQLLGIGMNGVDTGPLAHLIKLSMFNVSNPFDISEAHTQLVGSTYSDALYNHKSVLIDASKNIIGFKIWIEVGGPILDPSALLKCEFLIYGYDPTEGFYERAAIPLPLQYESTRALYINEYLYVVNGNKIGVYNLNTLEELIWISAH